ncbi:GNAT family N-acetyltransferase [Novosphingobium ovatum]|uniref:GNAT family N-acetyltransferase n=1 Tax=Novosphingobium ovatum TaxID=1908523 RepID=UPI001D12C214|nr:GNAT family N-acetyltransferase [Novosphingobium ovatum]
MAGWLSAPAGAPFDRLDWWAGLQAHCAMRPVLAVARNGAGALALPLAQGQGELTALANWYTFRVAPVVSGTPDRAALLQALARDLARRTGRITLTHVPDEDGSASAIAAGFRGAGWLVRMVVDDTNHILHLRGRDYATYLAARPGPLRTTLKRKAKKVACTIHTAFSDAAWAEYEAVYAQSWKPEEGAMAFLRDFARAEGAAGRLRLGLAHALDGTQEGVAPGTPLAAQLWSVEGGTAFIHKLAYVESAKPVSPGTSLSAALFAHVIDGDGVTMVDFGTGDDPYKRDWMEEQRPRYRLEMVRLDQPGQWPRLAVHCARSWAKRLVGAKQQG